jgi:hypothetical protein
MDEVKVPEVPVVVKPETPAEESLIDNPRAAVENAVIAEGQNVPAPEPEEVVTPEPKVEEPKVEDDPIKRIKDSVQKRIDKVIAKSKSVEEELAETKAELERLKNGTKAPETTPTTKDDAPPTIEQIEAYIIKMREEGNVKEEIAATRYLIKVEKELAIKEVQETQTKAQREAEAQKEKQLNDWTMLSKDYETTNPKDEMNLSNQQGLLYKTALALYNDKELHADFYNNSDVIQGFRRAVADAYREIHQQGLLKQSPKGEIVTEKKNPRMTLAEPSASESEEPSTPSISNSLSDAEKVREEIRARSKNRFGIKR